MKHLIACILLCCAASASTCTGGLLSTFMTPGYSCSLDGVTFSNFGFSSVSGGFAGVVTPSNVDVSLSNTGFRFTSDQFYAGDRSYQDPNGGDQQTTITYRVSGDIIGMLLGWVNGGSNDHSGPEWFATEDPHDLFLGPECCGGEYFFDSVAFSPEGTLSVTTQMTLHAGYLDWVAIDWISNEFTPVPEPGTLTLAATGLLLMCRRIGALRRS